MKALAGPRLRSAMASHALACRQRLRPTRLMGSPQLAGRVAQVLPLNPAERHSAEMWVRQGLSRADAVRIAIDPAMRPEARP